MTSRTLIVSLALAFSIIPGSQTGLAAGRIFRSGYPPADLELSKGKFLIASKKLMDPRFIESVVLLIHYSNEGAMGLIINHPAEVSLSAAIPEVPALKRSKESLYIGGPVDLSKVFLLLQSVESPDDSLQIFDNVYVSSSKKVLEKRILGKGSKERIRVYAGYTGWAAGQLELEIQTGHWLVWHADAEILFDKPAKDIWPEMMRRTTVLQAFAPRSGNMENPSLLCFSPPSTLSTQRGKAADEEIYHKVTKTQRRFLLDRCWLFASRTSL